MPVIFSLIGKKNIFNCCDDKFVEDCMPLLTLFSRYHRRVRVRLFDISTDCVAGQFFYGQSQERE